MKNTYKIVLVGLLSAILVALQVGLASIPNVELVSFLLLIYTLMFPLSMNILIAFIFVTIEMIVWGMGDWVIGYYWIWPTWVILVHFFKPIIKENNFGWALVCGLWGTLFGALFAINHGLFYGFNFSIAYWIKGIPFDIIHTVSNYVLTLVLFNPVINLFKQLHKEGGRNAVS